jgi:hypothetical protein
VIYDVIGGMSYDVIIKKFKLSFKIEVSTELLQLVNKMQNIIFQEPESYTQVFP